MMQPPGWKYTTDQLDSSQAAKLKEVKVMTMVRRIVLACLIAALLCMLLLPHAAEAQSVVSSSSARDWSLIGGGLLMTGGGKWLQLRNQLPEPGSLQPANTIPSFDHWALKQHSHTASVISDAGLISSVLVSGALTATLHEDAQRRRDVLVWGEALLFTTGVTTLVKNIVRRPRPEAYAKARNGRHPRFRGQPLPALSRRCPSGFLFLYSRKQPRF